MPHAIDTAYTNTSIEFAAGVEGALRNLQCHPQRNLTNRQQSLRISRHALQSHNDETSKKLCRRPHDLLRYARCGQARQLHGSEQTQSREFTDFDSRNRCISCSKRRLSAYPGIILGTLLWVALRKPPSTRTQIGRVLRQGYSNDPRHGTPWACADGRFCRGVDAGHVPWRKQQSVADQGNKGAAARAALAAPTKE